MRSSQMASTCREKLGEMHRVNAKGMVCTTKTGNGAVRVNIELWGKTVTETI